MADRLLGAVLIAIAAGALAWLVVGLIVLLNNLVPWPIPVGVALVTAIVVAIWDPGGTAQE